MKIIEFPSNRNILLPSNAPLEWARQFVRAHSNDGTPHIAYWQGDFWRWNKVWSLMKPESVRALAYSWLDDCSVEDAKTAEVKPFCPNKRSVDELLDAVRGLIVIPDSVAPFCWQDSGSNPDHMIVVENGLLDLKSGHLSKHSPALMATAAADWSWEKNPKTPTKWLAFLAGIFPHDNGEIALLQEVLGFLISGERRLQKIPILIGPPRSGKGTILQVLLHIIGQDRCAASLTAQSFAREFGLASTIGKRVAMLPDLRIGKQVDTAALLERFLQISGGDHAQIARKFRDDFVGAPTARLIIAANEIPRLPDDSGAMANRYVPIVTQRGFLDHENLDLLKQLLPEAQGIVLWAMQGLRRLWINGRFTLPESSRAVIGDTAHVGSPIRQFVDDECQLKPNATVTKEALFVAYRNWCDMNVMRPLNHIHFGRALRSAFPEIAVVRTGTRTEKRGYAYGGISLCV